MVFNYSQINVRSSCTIFTTRTQVKLSQMFTGFVVSLRGQKLNSKKDNQVLRSYNFLRFLKSWKTDEDLRYAVETLRSISMRQSRDKRLAKPLKLITHFPDIPLIQISRRDLQSITWSQSTASYLFARSRSFHQPLSALRRIEKISYSRSSSSTNLKLYTNASGAEQMPERNILNQT